MMTDEQQSSTSVANPRKEGGAVVAEGIGGRGGRAGPGLFPDAAQQSGESASLARTLGGPSDRAVHGECTEEQREIIQLSPGYRVVFAGPGSGKTTVLTRHIAEQLRRGRLRPSDITAITFTKQAALDIKRRLAEQRLLPEPSIAALRIGTFHAEVFRLLLQRTPNIPVVLSAWEQFRWMQMAARAEGLRRAADVRECLRLASILHAQWPPATFSDSPEGRAVIRYNRMKRSRGRWDYDDILLNFCERWSAGEPVWSGAARWKYLLVDEFQDTNAVQWHIVWKLARELGLPVFVVGDEDQSIYRFRGGSPAWLLGFQHFFPSATRHVLSVNFRSDTVIVGHAARLISHNLHRLDKPIRVASSVPGFCRALAWTDEGEEAQGVARRVRWLLSVQPEASVAVLARTRRQLMGVARALMQGPFSPTGARSVHPPPLGMSPLGVSFHTFHDAKGKEWDEVHIVGAVEDNPYLAQRPSPARAPSRGNGSYGSMGSESAEEERRLFYVAMTRARHSLWIHVPARVAGHLRVSPSRYVFEAGLYPES